MTLRSGGPGAYAPAGAVIAVIERYRERGLPAPVTAEVLVRATLTTESLAPRTIQSLKLLDLLDDDAQPTAELVALGQVPSDQFKERLAAILRTAYADVLKFTDPTKDDYARVLDAFRVYSPASLRDRMVTLFIGLAEHAGMISEDRAKELTGRRGASRTKSTGRASLGRSTPPKPQPEPSGNGLGSMAGGVPPPTTRASGGDSRSLTLRSGGTVTLAVSLNVFDLSKEDREFVWGLIDKMSEYERQTSAQPAQGLGSEHPGPHREELSGSTPDD